MAGKVRVAPSLLAADFTNLEREIRRIEEAGIEVLHIDVMDGHFVPNLTFGPPIVEALRKITALHFDVHLMLDNPGKFLKPFADAGADGITVHLEIHPEPEAILQEIGALGKVRGISLNPDMPVERLAGHLDYVDRILLMSVFPGFGGQKFIPESLERLRQIRALIGERDIELEIDGGITVENAAAVREAGATLLVAGTSTFRAPDIRQAVAAIAGEG